MVTKVGQKYYDCKKKLCHSFLRHDNELWNYIDYFYFQTYISFIKADIQSLVMNEFDISSK